MKWTARNRDGDQETTRRRNGPLMPSFERYGLYAGVTYAADATATVWLDGELDLMSVPVARQAIGYINGPTRRIVVDLSGLTYLDVAGARLLRTACQGAAGSDRPLILRGPSRRIRHMLQLTGVAGLISPGPAS